MEGGLPDGVSKVFAPDIKLGGLDGGMPRMPSSSPSDCQTSSSASSSSSPSGTASLCRGPFGLPRRSGTQRRSARSGGVLSARRFFGLA
jgi:hypothetical protein